MGKKGFTLIELSIVLVILGLMVGGITGGRALVKQASFQKIVKEVHGYQTAINAYRMQYNSLPGDHKEATQYWPGRTNDGNGDGYIWDNFNSVDTTAYYEHTKMWQHLVLAEIIPFRYFTSYDPMVVGENIPKGPVEGMGYRVQSFNEPGGTPIYARKMTNALVVARKKPSSNDTWAAFLKPADAKNIDQKMDDGIPSQGKVYGVIGEDNIGNCVTGHNDNDVTPATETYEVGNSDIACHLLYWLD